MGAVAAVALALLSGCSWFLPHPEKASNVIGDADTPEDGRCSLAVAQNRKSLTGQIIADGVPKPLIIHVQSPSAAMRAVRFGQSIYFDPSTSDADRDSKPPRSIAGHAIWRIESAQDPSTEVAEEAVLTGGSTFLLRDPSASGYLRLASKATSVAVTAVTAVTRAEASRFVILKADVPDSTRPTTCDEQIRDEDFVFVRILAPSAWVNVAAAGNLEVKPTPAGMRPAPGGSNTNPLCAREEERCHTDSRGGLVCAWAPVCAD